MPDDLFGTGGPPGSEDGTSGGAAEPRSATVHAACAVIGEAGVLIRGDPGAGKSSLALALIEAASRLERFATLIGDDRVRLERHNGRLVARPHPAITGLVEIRGFGITPIDSLPAAVLRLVVDLIDAAPRMPQPASEEAILGVSLPRLVLDRPLRDVGLAPGLVLRCLGVASQPHIGPVSSGRPASP